MFKLVRVVAKECEYACTVCVCVLVGEGGRHKVKWSRLIN